MVQLEGPQVRDPKTGVRSKRDVTRRLDLVGAVTDDALVKARVQGVGIFNPQHRFGRVVFALQNKRSTYQLTSVIIQQQQQRTVVFTLVL